jgi:hypothetical protein
MIFSIGFDVINIEDNLQISISTNTKEGDKIVRESRAEYSQDGSGNSLIEKHPTHNCLIKTPNNYFLLEGSLKVKYEWFDGDDFSNSDIDTYKDWQATNNPEHANCNPEYGDGYTKGTAIITENATGWKISAVKYEPDCKKATVEIVEDDTILLCPMQHDSGWTFEKADILSGGSIETNKSGTTCYIIFGQACKIGSDDVAKHAIKKLTSNSVTIENNSEKVCRLVKIYK